MTKTPPLPNKRYSIIYADPPWNFRTWSKKGKGRSAERHYHVPTLRELKEIPVQDIVEKDCALFMWATYPNLLQALELMESWQFTYRTFAFTWVKKNKKSDGFFTGLGYWTRANPEPCLFGTIGKPKRIRKDVRNLVIRRVGRHSEKPDEVRTMIVDLMGDLPRIELFARQKVPGWDAWGLEV